ncbi:MAG: tetratricopeptide repeat protein [Planctomycetes bacterium]|nr:tetratricopeptide repeat protein [Planctomycetota bacterium]
MPRPSPSRRPALAASAPLLLLLAACAGGPPPERDAAGRRVTRAEEKKPDPAIARAMRAMETGDVATARRELEAHLADEPDDAQARYILARALSAQGELRAARREVERALAKDASNALAWALLAQVSEQMGEHRRALQAYGRVHELVPESLDPLHGLARCLLYTGQAESALATLSAARERPVKDPGTEFLAFQALRRLGRSEQAEGIGRAYLELVQGRNQDERAAQADNLAEVRRWLEQRSEPLDQETRRVMVDAVRAAIRLRLPGAADPEDEVLAQGPPRLFSFDERPVFVTVYTATGAGGGGRVFRGRGRGKNLAAALKGAIQGVLERPGYTPISVKDGAVQVEVGHTLEAVTILTGRRGELETDPPLRRGVHGLALRVDRQEAYCLPSEPLTAALADLPAMLSHATRSAGLSAEAWQGAPSAFRFETDAWLSPAPGVAAVRLERGEPTPLPQGLPGELREAAHAGARWLTTQLRPEPEEGDEEGPPRPRGTTLLARSHDPTGRTLDPEEAAPAEAARVALACAWAHVESSDPVLLSAAEHLVRQLLPLLPPASRGAAHDDPAAQATLEAAALATVVQLGAQGRGPGGEVTRALATRLHAAATPPTRAMALLGLLAQPEPDRAALLDLAGLAREEPKDPLAVQALVALEAVLPESGAGDRALAWGRAQLSAGSLDDDADAVTRARRLTALARVARLAARRGHPDAEALRARTLDEARGVLALQLAPRHRHFVRNTGLSLGAFRSHLSRAELRPGVTAECVLALIACAELLEG